MTTYKRFAQIRSEGGEDSGEFSMVLASEGEAADGHVLSIRGFEEPSERIPLLLSHRTIDAQAVLGSITETQRDLDASPPVLHARGQIELGGEGPVAEIRRDVHHMIQRGHLNQVSVGWQETKPPVARSSLARSHPAYVDPRRAFGARRRGLYFEGWRAAEGSLVGVGSDQQGRITQRAEETTGEVSAYWQQLSREASHQELRDAVEHCRAAGFGVDDLAAVILHEGETASEWRQVRFGDATFHLPADLAGALEAERADFARHATELEQRAAATPPEPRMSAAEFGEQVREVIETFRAEMTEQRQRVLDAARGKL